MSEAAYSMGANAGGLLASDEQKPFEILNPEAASPLLLICDHASNFIPRAFANLGLDETQLARHIAYDIGIADVTRQLSRRLDATAVLSGFSRLIVDPNREPEDPTQIPQIGDDVVIPGNRDLSQAARRSRVEALFEPYHRVIDREIDRLLARGPAPALISMHSFTPVMHGFERPWQVCALWNKDARLPLPFMAKLRALGFNVGDNQPYSGRDHHGYTMHRHAQPRGLANLLIEIRQDLVDTHHGASEWAELLARALAEILADPTIYKAEQVK
ncbi:MAG: N-formylglutamate amidohydrolase [Kiloniellales bacterium]